MDLRSDFPIFENEQNLVYFDNACMTLRPRQVIEAIEKYYTHYSACAGRSNHHLAAKVSREVEAAREKIQKFIGAKRPQEIIFTRNTTEGLNLVANSIGLVAGDTVLISDKEHNSNLVPWLRLRDSLGINLKIVKDNTWSEAIVTGVKVVSVVMTSNLDGTSNDIKTIAKLAHKIGAMMVVDAAQAVPHQKMSVIDIDADFMAFSAHKMCGPSGIGAVYGKLSLLERLNPFMTGGDTVAKTTYESYEMLPVPEKFEAGLQDYAGIIGFGAAIDYLSQIGMDTIHHYEVKLNQELTQGLNKFDRVKILGPQDPKLRGGIASFVVDGADHHQVALMLDQMGQIAVRSGQHCVHSWFNSHDISGSVRASVYFYNTEEEVEKFLATFEKILRII